MWELLSLALFSLSLLLYRWMARREKTRGRPFWRLKSSATVLKRDRYIGLLMYGKVEGKRERKSSVTERTSERERIEREKKRDWNVWEREREARIREERIRRRSPVIELTVKFSLHLFWVMHINKEGRAGRCTGSEERGNAFVSGRLMVRDPRVSYDADSSLVNDYDNSTGSSGMPSRSNCRQPRR